MKISYTILMAAFNLIVSVEGMAQSCAGIAAGAVAGRLFDLRRDDYMEYTSKYHFKSGINATAFYQLKNDPFRFELQYLRQNVDLISTQYTGHVTGTQQNNLDFTFQQLNVKALRTFETIQKEHFRMDLHLGVVLGYIFNTRSHGTYSRPKTSSYTDTNGVTHNFTVTVNHSKDESNSNDLYKFRAGLLFGMEFLFPLREKFDLVIQNRYTVYPGNFVAVEYTGGASLLITEINVGLKYRIP